MHAWMNVKLLKGSSMYMFMQKMEEIIFSFFYFPFFYYITLDHHISASAGTKALKFKIYEDANSVHGNKKKGENSWGL